ncbi:hypothetical protein KsCSTR_06440 [Candidatus Kuenenia stuttgartiensis]|jgi:hypothetical protein|uniref:Uncharacterized protein n=1 Tax=Kuenenia stuttgartiensis TaxID=174633 RepID=Q1PZT9_KUEST|nr:hypothetical protein KsCSTR_06440 [Candidatus Kuenenia stuttgartiensis]CAJ72597.1 unknown protein [Candidatus Kuenenia stuttgartiensis]
MDSQTNRYILVFRKMNSRDEVFAPYPYMRISIRASVTGALAKIGYLITHVLQS